VIRFGSGTSTPSTSARLLQRGVLAAEGDVGKEVVDALRRSGYIGKEGTSDAVLLLNTLSAYIRTENFEEREQQRGYLDLAVLEYMKGQA
jgi:Putative peptidoglycan binding domain